MRGKRARGERWSRLLGRVFVLLPLTAYFSLLTSCSVTPLTNKISPGEDPFVIAVGEGADSLTDLFAAPAGGGNFVRVTFNRAEERGPRLAPDGRSVAYLRHSSGSPRWTLVVLNLLTNAERSAPFPADAGVPERLGWSADGGRIVGYARGYFATPAPPAAVALSLVDSAGLSWADSATGELLGPDGKGVVRPCGALLCIAVGDSLTSLGAGVRGAVRWGDDSVGYFSGNQFEVRPLRGGYARRPAWKELPARLREVSYHPGQVTTGRGVSGLR